MRYKVREPQTRVGWRGEKHVYQTNSVAKVNRATRISKHNKKNLGEFKNITRYLGSNRKGDVASFEQELRKKGFVGLTF